MATAAVVPGWRTTLHVRGTWSAREDRVPSAVWLGIVWVGMIAGFGLDFGRYLHEKPAPGMILHVHAAVFTVWMFLLTAQVLLVLGNRVAWHRTLGWFMAGWACLMLVLGPWAALASQSSSLQVPGPTDTQFLVVNIVNVVAFGCLLAWGISLRQNPAAHKRVMMLSVVAIADPGFARFSGWLWPQEPHSRLVWLLYMFYGNLLLLALMAGWDWWKGRLMRQFVVGAGGIVFGEILCSTLYFWGPWKVLTLGWVQAWARHFG
jgi:hypothetical protein